MTNTKSMSALRRLADREGYIIRKSRRAIGLDNAGDYMMLDGSSNIPVLGFRYDATPEDIQHFLTDDVAEVA
jgi:hypothetical protein